MNLPKTASSNNESRNIQNSNKLSIYIDKSPTGTETRRIDPIQEEITDIRDVGDNLSQRQKVELSTSTQAKIPPMTIDLTNEGNSVPTFFVDPNPIAVQKETEKFLPLIEKGEDHEKRYMVLGQAKAFRSQERNMVDKLNQFLNKTEAEKKMIVIEEEIDEVEKVNDQEDEFGFSSRYFQSNPTQTCRRCKKPGHFERWCPEEAIERCAFCAGIHATQDCPQMVCFNCYGMGHRARECVLPRSQNCYRCGKRGHKSHDCGIIILKDTYKDKKDVFDLIKCSACNGLGHITCQYMLPIKGNHFEDDIFGEHYQRKEREKKDDLDYEAFLQSHSREDLDYLGLDSEEDPRDRGRSKNKSKSKSKSRDRTRNNHVYFEDSDDEDLRTKRNKKKTIRQKKDKEDYHDKGFKRDKDSNKKARQQYSDKKTNKFNRDKSKKDRNQDRRDRSRERSSKSRYWK